VLDIGCSSGAFLGYLKGGPWKVHGIEANQATAERARARTGAEVFAGDVLDASFPPDEFDVITCMDVLEHLYEPREVLRKVHNWLKPGGVFYVFVPNIMSWEARIFRSCWFGLYLPRHIHLFSTRSLTKLADSVGLCPLRMITPPGSALEQDTRIVIDDLARRAGLRRGPLDLNGEANLPWKVLRKGLRLTVEPLYDMIASRFGAAGAIQAVFKKGTQPKELKGIS
jgi:SAM-dependent methyltransferase